jgi:PAS domain S-box-containing protein
MLIFYTFNNKGIPKGDLYLMISLLTWSALRFGPLGTSAASFIIAVITTWLWGNTNCSIFLLTTSQLKDIVMLQAYLIIAALTSLMLSIVIISKKVIQEDLEREKDLLKTIMGQLPDTIYFKDTKSRITRINKANALGMDDPDDGIGKTDSDYAQNDFAQATFEDEQKIIETGKPLLGKLEFCRDPINRTRWISATKIPIISSYGEITGIAGISRDFTTIKKIEQELREMNNSKDKLFAIIAHDLKSPFLGLIGLSNLILEVFDELSLNYRMLYLALLSEDFV